MITRIRQRTKLWTKDNGKPEFIEDFWVQGKQIILTMKTYLSEAAIKFCFPIGIIDENFQSENPSGLSVRVLADAMQKEAVEVLGMITDGADK